MNEQGKDARLSIRRLPNTEGQGMWLINDGGQAGFLSLLHWRHDIMATKLSQRRHTGGNRTTKNNDIGPSLYYKTRVRRALELLQEAAYDDIDYQGDMLSEGIREGLITAAIIVVTKVAEAAEFGELARDVINKE